MRKILSHFEITNKSLYAFVLAILSLLTCYKVMGIDAAAAWATFSMAVLSILIPKRDEQCTKSASVAIAPAVSPNAPVKDED